MNKHNLTIRSFAFLFLCTPAINAIAGTEALVLTPTEIMLQKYNCISCHTTGSKKDQAGPKYLEVANKYRGDASMVSTLVEKVIDGGRGVWGRTPMPATRATSKEVMIMITYILAITDDGKTSKRLDNIPTLVREDY